MVCRVGWRGESHEPRETGVSCIVQERGTKASTGVGEAVEMEMDSHVGEIFLKESV